MAGSSLPYIGWEGYLDGLTAGLNRRFRHWLGGYEVYEVDEGSGYYITGLVTGTVNFVVLSIWATRGRGAPAAIASAYTKIIGATSTTLAGYDILTGQGDKWDYLEVAMSLPAVAGGAFKLGKTAAHWARGTGRAAELGVFNNGFRLGRHAGLSVRRPQDIGIHRPPRHHIFPQEHRSFFADRGFTDIDNYTIPLDGATHTAIHTWMGSGRWNDVIVQRVLAREAELGRMLNRREVMQIGAQMRREAGLQHIKVITYLD